MATYVNQDMINAFHDAAAALGLRNRWELLERAGLSLADMAQARNIAYAGPDIDQLPNLSDSERAQVKQRLPASGPPVSLTQGRTTAPLNLRSGPGTENAILTTLPPDTAVQILNEQGDWLHVTVDGRSGFVHRDFVLLPTHGMLALVFRLPFVGGFIVTQPFGFDPNYPANSGWHFGIDFGCPMGTPVVAAADGVVAAASPNLPVGFPGVGDGNWGNYVQLQHADGLHSGYAHLSRIDVSQGQPVRQGQPLGASGDTGLTFGAHLHFQCIKGGTRINPSPFLA